MSQDAQSSRDTPSKLPGQCDIGILRERERSYSGDANAEDLVWLANEAGAHAVKSLSYSLESRPWRKGIMIEGKIAAHVVMECVATLEPIKIAINERVVRGFLLPEHLYDAEGVGLEIEISDDFELGEPVDPLEDPLDLSALIAETLALALPEYPRADNTEPVEAAAAPAGTAPLTDDDVKPFADLKALRDKMSGAEE